MGTNFPTSVDSLVNPTSSDTLDNPSHSDQHINANDAIEAIETYLIDRKVVGVRAYNSTTQSVNSGSETAIALNNEEWDTNSFHDNATNNSRITIPAGLGGRYLIEIHVTFAANSTGQRILQVLKNGTTYLRGAVSVQNAGASVNALANTLVADLVAGDYIQVMAIHDAGVALNLGSATTQYQNVVSVTRLTI